MSTLSDWHFTLTPARAKALVDSLTSTIEGVEETDDEGAASFVVNLNAYLRPGGLRDRGIGEEQ